MNKRARAMVNYLISIVIALLLAFAIIGALLLWQGVDPVETFLALFQGAFIGKSNLVASLLLATPLILGGLGIALSFRCGIFNIGGEGQLYLGAFAATWLGVNLAGLPFWLHIPICFLGSMIFGGLWALIPGYLKISKGYNETVTSVLLELCGGIFCQLCPLQLFQSAGRAESPIPQDPGLGHALQDHVGQRAQHQLSHGAADCGAVLPDFLQDGCGIQAPSRRSERGGQPHIGHPYP